MRFRIEIHSNGHVYAGESVILNDALVAATECLDSSGPSEEEQKEIGFELLWLQQIAKSVEDDYFGYLPPEALSELKEIAAEAAHRLKE